jgi:biopolymer transport protein ExbD
MKSKDYLYFPHMRLTAVLFWLVLALSSITREVQASPQVAVQDYNPKISIPPQPDIPKNYGIRIKILDTKRIQIGTEIFPFDQMTKRLTPEFLIDKKSALIVADEKIQMEQIDVVVNHLGRHGIFDITFSQK